MSKSLESTMVVDYSTVLPITNKWYAVFTSGTKENPELTFEELVCWAKLKVWSPTIDNTPDEYHEKLTGILVSPFGEMYSPEGMVNFAGYAPESYYERVARNNMKEYFDGEVTIRLKAPDFYLNLEESFSILPTSSEQ